MEDLLSVTMTNENLVTFIRNWDTVLSGIQKTPEDTVLEPLFHRQIKKCRALQHDINVYERAAEGTAERSFKFLYDAATAHINRKRLERNRERIARQSGAPQVPAMPAPQKVPKGFCIAFVKNGSCKNGEKCKYKHQVPSGRPRTPTPGRGRGPRSPSRTGSPSRGPRECKFFKQGRCDRGDKCTFLHTGKPGAAAPSGGSAKGSAHSDKSKGRHKKKKKDRKGSRPSSKDSKGSKNSKGSNGSRKSGGSGRKKGGGHSIPTAVCLLGAMMAGTAHHADAYTLRKDESCWPSHYSEFTHLALAAVSFDDSPDYINFPLRDGELKYSVEYPKRTFTSSWSTEDVPSGNAQSTKDALMAARMLRASVRSSLDGVPAKCNFCCDTEFGCDHCIPKGLRVTCPAKPDAALCSHPMEWIGDTGSAQDLISERELADLVPFESDCPINISTANGPGYANRQCEVGVPSINSVAKPYVLPNTPSVLSVGQRCMEQGYDFIWKGFQRPYFKVPGSGKVYLDVRDNVPYLKSWKEGTACPARRIAASSGGSRTDPEIVAKELLQNQDFSHRSCLKLLKESTFKQPKSRRSAIRVKDDRDSKYLVFGAFSHGGMQGITKRSKSYPKVIQYLLGYLRKHGVDGPVTSLAVNCNSDVKMHKDVNNHRDHDNFTISLGDFTGGQLWVHDNCLEKNQRDTEVMTSPSGDSMVGKLWDSRENVVTFNPKSYHCVTPWKGERWSITAYVNRAIHKLSPDEITKLKEYGFLVPRRSVEVPAAPVEIDEEMTLHDLAMMDLPKSSPDRARKPETKSKGKPTSSPKEKSASSKAKPSPPEPDWSRVEEQLREAVAPLPPPAHPPESVLYKIDEGGSLVPAEPSDSPPHPEGVSVAPGDGAGRVPEGDGKRSRAFEKLKAEAKSTHHLMSHQPKNPFCDVCQRAKMYKQPSYQTDGTHSIEAKAFGDHLTADHIIVYRDKGVAIEESRLALVMKDVFTGFTYAYPSALRSEDECIAALQHFVSSSDEVGVFYSDQAQELISSAKFLGWRHELSKAYIHQSNAIAERAVRATTEGTRSNLLQAGLSHVYWPQALEHSCAAFNVSNLNGPKYTPWYKRFGYAFPGKIIPFGCRVDYWVGPKNKRRKRDRFEPTSEPGIFLGYYFQPGMKWRNEILALPLKELNRQDFHECLKPVKAYQFHVPNGEFVFPMRERYEKVQQGLATDALEGPVSQSLTNQDAEPALEQDSVDADRKDEPSLVIDPKSGKMIPIPEGGGYYDSGGTLGRRYGGTRGSRKPDSIPSDLWVRLSKKQKDKAIEDEVRENALRELESGGGGSSSSSGKPAAVANASKDEWVIRGDKLIRFHYIPRKELFSPDLTDCPVPIASLGRDRVTKIMPLGGTEIIPDADEWRNVRRRNKKLSYKWIGRTEFSVIARPDSSGQATVGSQDFPCMPTVPTAEDPHRTKVARAFPETFQEITEAIAMVARPVGKKELMTDSDAQASLDMEWDKLIKKKAWDMSTVREWDDVSKEAAKKGKKAHVGKIFEICVEKGSELPKGNPLRKFKGRTVFQGNNVRDENNDTALFSELGSSPATMEAGKVLDAYGHAPNHGVEQADGKQAYTQTTLKGADTWVRLPRERWPKEWIGKYKDPVVRLRLALYGHPDSGGFWEQHCEKRLKEVGFELVYPAAWPSVFFHPTLRLLLAVYVDDFKMAGPKENLAKGWELIGSRIDMDTPTPIGRYLGCEHISRTEKQNASDHPFAHVFDKHLPDPAAKPASVVVKEDFTEYFPEEGVIVRHHVQPRKVPFKPRAAEALALDLGSHRLTVAAPLGKEDSPTETWDSGGPGRKSSDFWTGVTYLTTSNHTEHSALAAVKRVRDKNSAKKEARKHAFYDVNQLSDHKGAMYAPTKQVVYDMSSFLQQAVDRYKELTGPEWHHLKKVTTPFYDDKIARPTDAEAEPKGKLAPIASRVLMKLLFAARMARFDLLRAVQGLASRITKWSTDCDKALHRLMCYVASTLDHRMSCFIGDDLKDCKLWLFADSDHAGEHDNKSTSGGFLALVGPNTYFPLSAFSKKQTSTALSSTEAEVVCANVSLRALGLPSSALWSVLLNAGGDAALKALKSDVPKGDFNSKTHPFPEMSKITKTGKYLLSDGRQVEVFNKMQSLPNPVELSSHPIRDLWLLRKGKWEIHQKAVAWEELDEDERTLPPTDFEAGVLVYRRSTAEYRRHAEAEAILHRETAGIRSSGGVDVDEIGISRTSKDMGLIMSVPHSIQPVVLEDNQATIRILESGKSPAFRHADKTQRINLGWIAEQFRRKHYDLAYINTLLQAADILTKPFTSTEKWSNALRLLGISQRKLERTKAHPAGAATAEQGEPSRPEGKAQRVIIEVCCNQDSIIGELAHSEFPECKVVRITESMDLNSPDTRKEVLKIAKSYHRAGAQVLTWVSLPCTGGSAWTRINLKIPKNRDTVLEARKDFRKLWASFVDLSQGLDQVGVQYCVEWPRDCEYWGWSKIRKWLDLHPFVYAKFDGCRFGLKDRRHNPVKKPWCVATTLETLHKKIHAKVCTGDHSHAKCLKESENYPKSLARAIHSAFKEHCKATAAVAQALHHSYAPVCPAIPLSEGMALALSQEERKARIEDFKLALQDPDRRADAMAGLLLPPSYRDLADAVVEPDADAADDELFLGIVPVYRWRALRAEHPTSHWTILYEQYYRDHGVRVFAEGDADTSALQDSTLGGWIDVLYRYAQDLANIAWGPRSAGVLDATRHDDICRKVELLSRGASKYTCFHVTSELMGKLFSPALQRIPLPSEERLRILVVGDSSLALCQFKGRSPTHRTNVGIYVEEALRHDRRFTSIHYEMVWGAQLDELHAKADSFLGRNPHPDGVATHVIISWSGNDVWGSHGYHGYTWHLNTKYTNRSKEELEALNEWPTKQRLRVEKAVRNLRLLLARHDVCGITVLTGDHHSEVFPTGPEYGLCMEQHADAMLALGINIVDPIEMYGHTSKPDDFHADASDRNKQVMVPWHCSLLRGVFVNHQLMKVRDQLVANQRDVVFHNHFLMGKAEPFLTVPPASAQLIHKPIEDPNPPQAREAEEEIVLSGPLLGEMEEPSMMQVPEVPNAQEEISDLDFARLDTRPGAGCVVEGAESALLNVITEDIIKATFEAVKDATEEELKQAAVEAQVVNLDDFVEAEELPAEAKGRETYVAQPGRIEGAASSADVRPPAGPTAAMEESEDEVVIMDAPLTSEATIQKPFTPAAKPKPPALPRWMTADQLPPLPDDYRWLTPGARVALSKKISFLTRGFAEIRAPHLHVKAAEDHSLRWDEFFEKLSQMWRGLRVENVVDALLHNDKLRFEIKVNFGLNKLVVFHAIRAIQGHNATLLSDETDLNDTHAAVYHLAESWFPTLKDRPPVGTEGIKSEMWTEMPPLGYHSTKWSSFGSIVENGLIPGGCGATAEGARNFLMMSPIPAWERRDHQGVRENAEIEFVVDLQLAALDGVRILRTKADAVETPDWLSNRYLIYAYERKSLTPIWHNRVYEQLRVRVHKARKDFLAGREPGPIYEEHVLRRWQSKSPMPGCYIDFLCSEAEDLSFDEYKHICNNMHSPFQIAEDENITVNGEAINADDVTFHTEAKPQYVGNARWGSRLKTWYSALGRRTDVRYRSKLEHYVIQEFVDFPTLRCGSCNRDFVDGMINCPWCSVRISAESDMAHVTETKRARDEASRRGTGIDLLAIAPRKGLAMNRHRVRQGRDDDDISLPAAVRGKCLAMKKSLAKRGGGDHLLELLDEPLDAYNYVSKGIDIGSLAQLELFTRLHNPAPGGDARGRKEFAGSHNADARLSIAWMPGDTEIVLNRAFFIAFSSRLYILDEAAMLIYATQQTYFGQRFPFSILGFDGEIYTPEPASVTELAAQLAEFFKVQLGFAGTYDDPAPTEVTMSGNLRIPEGFASMGQTQLNEVLRDTRFYDRRLARTAYDPEWVRASRARSAGYMRAPPPPGRDGPRASSSRRYGRASASPARQHSEGANDPTRDRTRSSSAYGANRGRSPRRTGSYEEPTSKATPPRLRSATPRPPAARRQSSQQDQPAASRRRVEPTNPTETEGEWLRARRERVNQMIETRLDELTQLLERPLGITFPYDVDGEEINGREPRHPRFNRLEAYYWAMLYARDQHYIQEEEVVNCIPSFGQLNRVVVYDYENVIWYLNGWEHKVTDPFTGETTRRY